MKNKFPLLIVLFLISIAVNSQVVIKGVVLKNHRQLKQGDTINVLGYDKYSQKYLVDMKGRKIKMKSAKLQLLLEGTDFWQKQWFIECGYRIAKKGWDSTYRNELMNQSNEYLNKLRQENIIFKDEITEDYLNVLLRRIHPTKLNKNLGIYPRIYIVRADQSEIFSLENGAIIMTTHFINSLKSEEQLIRSLAKELSYMESDGNVINLRKIRSGQAWAKGLGIFTSVVATVGLAALNEKLDYNYFTVDDTLLLGLAAGLITESIVESQGAKRDANQIAHAKLIANRFMFEYKDKNKLLAPKQFIKNISNIITYTAWQKFRANNYDETENLLNKLSNTGNLTVEDLLLKIRLYRMKYSDDTNNKLALGLIQKAKSLPGGNLVELYKEEGFFYLRLNQNENAKMAFERYKQGIEKLNEQGIDFAKELSWVNRTLAKLQ